MIAYAFVAAGFWMMGIVTSVYLGMVFYEADSKNRSTADVWWLTIIIYVCLLFAIITTSKTIKKEE